MKKKILVCAFIVVCFSIVAYGTLAYFTYEDTATNIITMGNIKIELHELTVTDEGTVPVKSDEEMCVVPGLEVSRTIQVKNVGSNDAWIRIEVQKVIELAKGVEENADVSLIELDINTEFWTLNDGYFYYNEKLEPSQTTRPLFTTIKFSESMSDIYQESTAIVTVYVQATQTANNGNTVFEATGWPAKTK